MKNLFFLSVLSLTCLALLSVTPVQGDYLMVKDVLSTSGGHLESSSYLLDYSTGQVAVGQSEGTDHIETGGFWGWARPRLWPTRWSPSSTESARTSSTRTVC